MVERLCRTSQPLRSPIGIDIRGGAPLNVRRFRRHGRNSAADTFRATAAAAAAVATAGEIRGVRLRFERYTPLRARRPRVGAAWGRVWFRSRRPGTPPVGGGRMKADTGGVNPRPATPD